MTVQSLIEIIHTFTLTDIDQGDGGVQLADLAQALAEVLGRRRHQDDSNAEDVVEVEDAAAVLDEAGDYSDTTVLAPGSVSGQAGEAENADVGVVETLKTVEKEEAEADQLDTEVRLSGIRQILLERLVGQLGQAAQGSVLTALVEELGVGEGENQELHYMQNTSLTLQVLTTISHRNCTY